jgi:hypothetical protein
VLCSLGVQTNERIDAHMGNMSKYNGGCKSESSLSSGEGNCFTLFFFFGCGGIGI